MLLVGDDQGFTEILAIFLVGSGFAVMACNSPMLDIAGKSRRAARRLHCEATTSATTRVGNSQLRYA